MTPEQVDRIEHCAAECEGCMVIEDRQRRMGDFLAAADWADLAEFWASEAFRAAGLAA